MSNYTQITLDTQLNPNKHHAHTFAHICLYDERKHIRGNTYEIITEHHLNPASGPLHQIIKSTNGRAKVTTHYSEKLARIATLSTFTVDKLTDAVAWLALGMSAREGKVLLIEAYRRVIREEVEKAHFAFIVFETVEQAQDMSAEKATTPATQHKTTSPTAAAPSSRPDGELNLVETAIAS